MNKSKNTAQAIPLAILFTDIVGSTKFFASKGDRAGLAMLERHNHALFPLIRVANGRIVKTIGDSIFAVFERPDDALCAAFSMQRLLSEMRGQPNEEDIPHIRIGVHYGLVTEVGKDVFGDAVNLGERVKSAAEGDQILASRTLREMLRANPQFVLQSVGMKELKGASEPMELFELSAAPLLPSVSGWQVWSQRARGPLTLKGWQRWLIVVCALGAMGPAIYILVTIHNRPPFEHYTIDRVTDSESVVTTAISPDATYLASVVKDAKGNQSLSVHHIPTNSDRTIVQDPTYKYDDVIFSPDGNYVYFRVRALGTPPPNREDIYRIPLLGGQPALVLEDVSAPISFFPGKESGTQLVCAYREAPSTNTWKILSVDADGGNEQVLANGKAPFPHSMACSPDGKRAALLVAEDYEIEVLDFASSSRKGILDSKKVGLSYPQQMRWQADGKGLFAFGEGLLFASYPGGRVNVITHDLNHYQGISLSADGKTLATTLLESDRKLRVLSLADPSQLEEHGTSGLFGFAWMNNDEVIAIGQAELKMIDLRTDESANINTAKGFSFNQAGPCGPDSLVASANNQDKSLWGIYKLHLDGSGLTQITQGSFDLYPQCSPDGKLLYYQHEEQDGTPDTVRRAIEGGPVTKLPDMEALSADGKLIASVQDASPTGKVRSPQLVILSLETLLPMHKISLPQHFQYASAFSADGKSVYYPTWDGKTSTLWRQPLDSSAPVKVADIPGEHFYSFAVSPDGTKLGFISETTPKSRAVLLHATE